MFLTKEELVKATGGVFFGEIDGIETANISRDSRMIENGCMFAAIKGEKFDAHDFVADVKAKGACAVLVEHRVDCGLPELVVKSTRTALGDIARFCLEKMNIPVVAITGSTGKTTTKDIIASVLAVRFKTHKTQSNFNNDIGLPFTVFSIENGTEVAVLEMGMNHFKEIEYLSSIAKPDVSVITNVGVSHIENLGSREGILQAKSEIFSYQKPNGLKVLNGDDDMLITVKQDNVSFFSLNDSNCDFYATDIKPNGLEGVECVLNTPKGSVKVNIPVPGNHMVSNALAATAVGLHFGLTFDEIKCGIEGFKLTAMRMDIIKANSYTIINDVYNANPTSVRAAIDVLNQANGNVKYAVLGDMLELGDFAKDMHIQVGEYAAKCADKVIAVGTLAKHIALGAGEKAEYFADADAFIEKTDLIPKGAVVLVKASRGMHFEKITERLREI